MAPTVDIDISENKLRNKGEILSILLLDRTTKKNIIWATDSYIERGKVFYPNRQMTQELVTGIYGKLIQPRAAKSLAEQRFRTKEKAEVFTPLKTVDQMNKMIDWAGEIKVPDVDNWQDYVKELKLEISCGEAPFIVSRYNPTAHTGKVIELKNRVGFLDRKLRAVSRYCKNQKEWIHWAKEACKASYGYEWQGDNILIARENLLYSIIDYYKDKFGRNPSLDVQQEFAEIISWNIFQMDGLKYVVPMSCHHETRVIPGELTLFGETPDTVESYECEGCKFNRPTKHNGKYVKVMDWTTGKNINFVNLVTELKTHQGR
ncbi:MAG: hypothetical protein WAW80_03805 [Candidatus Saccharimonadales bacterium]